MSAETKDIKDGKELLGAIDWIGKAGIGAKMRARMSAYDQHPEIRDINIPYPQVTKLPLPLAMFLIKYHSDGQSFAASPIQVLLNGDEPKAAFAAAADVITEELFRGGFLKILVAVVEAKTGRGFVFRQADENHAGWKDFHLHLFAEK